MIFLLILGNLFGSLLIIAFWAGFFKLLGRLIDCFENKK
jgi:hypothetical protein